MNIYSCRVSFALSENNFTFYFCRVVIEQMGLQSVIEGQYGTVRYGDKLVEIALNAHSSSYYLFK